MVMRITGLSSGMDIDKMVSDLMKAERAPLDKLTQKKQLLSWQMDDYREVNSKLSAFQTYLNGIRFSTPWTQSAVSSSDSTKVAATADGNASAISHTISVAALASGARETSAAGITASPSLTGDAIAGSVTIMSGTSSDNNQLEVTLNGASKTITLTDGTYNDAGALQTELQKQLDKAFGVNQLSVTVNAGNQLEITPIGSADSLPQVVVNAVDGNDGITALGFHDNDSYKVNRAAKFGTNANDFSTPLTLGTFKINGIEFTIDADDTLSSIMSEVNNSSADVNMSYDEVSDKIILSTKGVGVTSQINLEEGTSNFLTATNLLTGGATSSSMTGVDADVTIDGVQSHRSSNSFTVDGVTYTLNGVTSSDVSVNVSRDTDAIFNQIKDFVSQYNDLVDLMNSKTKETKYHDFAPLTDDQKAAMNDDDIAKWEDKAKSGLLHGDDILTSTLNSMRSYMSSTVTSISTSYNALYKIGVTTMPYNSNSPNDSGKLQIDESKLKDAIAKDPDGVISLFTHYSLDDVDSEKGIANALYDRVGDSISSLIQRAGRMGGTADDRTTDIGLQLYNLDDNIDQLNDKLSAKEDYYYQQFSTMETAINNANSQMQWLTAQMG